MKMLKNKCLVLFLLFSNLQSAYAISPPNTIPDSFWGEFTDEGNIPVEYSYEDFSSREEIFIPEEEYAGYLQKGMNKQPYIYHTVDSLLFEALDQLKAEIFGKEIAVIAPIHGYYESVLLSYFVNVTVITNDKVKMDGEIVEYMSLEECIESGQKFDMIVSIQFVHGYGMGKFGESIAPLADLKLMSCFADLLENKGKLLVSLPVGKEKVIWNSGRVYDARRLKKAFQNWNVKKYFGFRSEYLHKSLQTNCLFLLEKK